MYICNSVEKNHSWRQVISGLCYLHPMLTCTRHTTKPFFFYSFFAGVAILITTLSFKMCCRLRMSCNKNPFATLRDYYLLAIHTQEAPLEKQLKYTPLWHRAINGGSFLGDPYRLSGMHEHCLRLALDFK